MREHLRGLWRFYHFCLEEQVENIEKMELEKIMDYQKQAGKEGQPKAAGIIDACWKIL